MKKSVPGKFLVCAAASAMLLLCAQKAAYAKGAAANFQAPRQDSVDNLYRIALIDENEQQIENATVRIKGSSAEQVSRANGVYALAGSKGDVAEVLVNGTVVKQYALTADKGPVVILSSKNAVLAQAKDVKLLFNITSPSNLTAASTQAVYTNDLTKMPVTSVRSALTGRIAGLYTNQTSGLPGSDGVSLSLRGRDPLVVIDGIPRGLTVFDLEEIESVTVLKDALATAMLGVRGNNGALLITTRKGSQARQRISFTAQTSFQKPLKMPQALGSFDYATLYNEALLNDPAQNATLTPYSPAQLQGYQTGSDPYLYPNVDWRNQVLEPSTRFDRYTLNTSGGSQSAKYFVGLEYLNQTGLLKTSDINKYNTNNGLQSYVVRSNVDLNINPKLSGGIHLLGRILNGNDPGSTAGGIFNSFLSTPNNAYPLNNPNGSYGGTQQFQNNILAQAIGSGYRLNYKRDMLADVFLKRTLDELAKGFWAKATASFYATLSETSNRSKSFAVFQRTVPPAGPDVYTQYGTNGTQANSTGIDYQGRSNYVELALGYDKNVGPHGFNATLLGNIDNSVSGSDLPYTITGTSGRFAYNYKQKYVAELAFGLNGSNRYAPAGSTKYGFFPAAGLAWNLEKEDFLKGRKWLNALKLFASYGTTGWDNPGYFTYEQYYFDGGGYTFGTGASGGLSMNEQVLANPNISWEKANKFNAGLQGSFLGNKLSWTLEYYNNKFSDMLVQRGKNSSIIGNSYPDENIGQYRYNGLDLQIGWQQEKGSFSYYVAANAGMQDSKVLFIDEVAQPYAWMRRTGQRVGQPFGYIADGLFQSAAEIASSATIEGYSAKPGDIKYRDLNNDGIINQFDQAPVGTSKPLLSFGLNTGFAWKGFDLSMLVQGARNRDIALTGNAEWEFQNNGTGQAYEQHLGRWTPATAASATYPRLSIGTNINNHVYSSYWVHSGNYLRLKNAEIGYTVPAYLSDKIKMSSARVFVGATNLFTLSAYDRTDPEVYGGAYPIQRLFTLGLNVKF